ncbi:MAG TPA: HAMP domain-containing sensor histidine kinase [Nocardioides sp.]|nr:HAMP domain-containing sensor histidine kinase [Nocardioides sp.]
MDSQPGIAPPPARARTSSWGGPEAWAELRRIADHARQRAGFRVSSIEVLRGDGMLELVAFTGRAEEHAAMGESVSLGSVRRVLAEGTRYGKFVFLAEEDMDADLQEAIRGYGYVPSVPESDDPQRWRSLDMLVAPLVDGSGRIRALLHLDEPLSGRRPPPGELQEIADRLELVLQAAVATVDREELTRHARLDETARSVVRAASRRLTARDLLAHVHFELAVGFRARALAVRLHGEPGELWSGPVPAASLPEAVLPAVEAATRRAWSSRTVIIAEPGQVWGDDQLDRDHRDALTAHLLAHDARELLLVPVGAGPEAMGVLVVVRDGRTDRWTESESMAALGVGHDLGRALLSTRAHEREQRLIEELQRLDEYRRQLIATVSHELKNPLGVIVGHVEMLGSVPGMPTAAEKSLAALGRSAARLTSVVDDLLLLSRVGNGDEPLDSAPVDLASALAEVVEDESIHAAQQGVTIQTVTSGGPLRVSGAREELCGVLANLVSNAVKYSRAGGTVELSLERHDGEVVFSCADDGLGISEEDRAHLFTEFFRSTNPEALQRPGTGLGLAIVARIVRRHRGRIDVESELGVGTTFRVMLPATRPGGAA